MKKSFVKIMLSIAMLFSLMCVAIEDAYAAAYSVSTKNNGDGSVTVTVSGNVVGAFTVSAGGQSSSVGIYTIGGSGSTTLKTGSGSFTVTVTPTSISDENYNILDNNANIVSKTVTVTDGSSSSGGSSSGGSSSNSGSNSGSSSGNNSSNTQETPSQEQTQEETPKSTDNTLSSLSVDKGTLNPAFSSDVTDYTVDLTNSETEITISATANDSKASVSGTGLQPLKIGANSFAIDVTSESGSRKSYIVNVNVSESPTVFLEKDGNQMGVLNNLEGVNIPKGFSETKITVNGEEVTALVNEDGSVTLLYMQNADGQKQFFIYDPDSTTYSIYNPVELCGLDLAIIDIPTEIQSKEGMSYGPVEVNEQTFYGWKFDDEGLENYTLLYLMDGSGVAHYYMHDSVLDTLQVYDNLAPLTAKKLNDMSYDLKVYTYCTYGFGAAAGILLLFTLFFAFTKKKGMAFAGINTTSKSGKTSQPKKTKKKKEEKIVESPNTENEFISKVESDLFDEVNQQLSQSNEQSETKNEKENEDNFFSSIPNDAIAFIDPLEPKQKKTKPSEGKDEVKEDDDWIDSKMVESVLSDLPEGKQEDKQ